MKAEYRLILPRGWRFLRLGEIIRKGDRSCCEGEDKWYATGSPGKRFTPRWRRVNGPYIRRQARRAS